MLMRRLQPLDSKRGTFLIPSHKYGAISRSRTPVVPDRTWAAPDRTRYEMPIYLRRFAPCSHVLLKTRRKIWRFEDFGVPEEEHTISNEHTESLFQHVGWFDQCWMENNFIDGDIVMSFERQPESFIVDIYCGMVFLDKRAVRVTTWGEQKVNIVGRTFTVSDDNS